MSERHHGLAAMALERVIVYATRRGAVIDMGQYQDKGIETSRCAFGRFICSSNNTLGKRRYPFFSISAVGLLIIYIIYECYMTVSRPFGTFF